MRSGRSSRKSLRIFRAVATFPLVVVIRFYQYCISPFVPKVCRYEPSCSVYAVEALHKHGLFKGSYIAIKRILSCNPWGGSGYDPVP